MPAATILGGGIGGLAMANALQRVGIPFSLYEQAPQLTEVGAGIGLSRGAMQVLDALGCGESARAASIQISRMCFASKDLEVRRWMPDTYTGYCIHRAALIDILKRSLPDSALHLSSCATAVNTHPDHAEIVFETGLPLETPLLIAADGVNSVARRSLLPDIAFRPIHQTIWRGVSDCEVPAMLRDTYIEIWDQGLRFLTVPLDATRTFWLGVQSAPPGGMDNPETLKADLLALFREFHPALRQLIETTNGRILRNDMGDLGPPRNGWHQGHTVFVGDAIHATTPNLAQGGCQAIEDALCLALCLDTHDALEEAFDTYHRLRRKKVSFVVNTSWTFGRAAHSPNPLFHRGYRAVLEHAPSLFLERQEHFLSDLSYLSPLDQRGLL